jgi:hypothetical protein
MQEAHRRRLEDIQFEREKDRQRADLMRTYRDADNPADSKAALRAIEEFDKDRGWSPLDEAFTPLWGMARTSWGRWRFHPSDMMIRLHATPLDASNNTRPLDDALAFRVEAPMRPGKMYGGLRRLCYLGVPARDLGRLVQYLYKLIPPEFEAY